MAAEIIELGPHSNMSVEECLKLCLRQHADFKHVMVIGWDEDGDLKSRSSTMTRADANWLIDAAKQSITHNGNITMVGGPFPATNAEENPA